MARFRPRRRSSAPFSTRRQSRLRRFRNLFPRFSPLARLRGVDVLNLFRGARRERRFSTAYLPSLGRRHSLVEGLEPKMMLTANVEFSVAAAQDLEGSGGNLPALIVDGTTASGGTVSLAVTNLGGVNPDATQGSDYLLSGSVFIPAGVYNQQVFTLEGNINIIDDAEVEPPEEIDLILIDPDGFDDVFVGDANGNLSTQFTHIYTILNDDVAFDGTAGDDNILIQDIGGGMVRITNTANPGSNIDIAAPTGAGGITIDAKGGNDTIEIDRSIFAGAGGNPANRSFGGKIAVLGGADNDTIFIDTDGISTLGIDLDVDGGSGDDAVRVPFGSALGARNPSAGHSRLVISTDPNNASNPSNLFFDSITIDDSTDADNTDADGDSNNSADTTLPGSGNNEEAIFISGSFNTLRLENSTLISDSDDIIVMGSPESTVQVFTGNNSFIFNADNSNGEVNGRAFIRNNSITKLLFIDLEENRPTNTGGGGGRLEASTPQATPITLELRTDSRNVVGASASNGFVTINGNGTITYTPNIGFSGTDTITYSLSGNGQTGGNSGRVFINVATTNDPPVNSLPSQFGPIDENLPNGDPVTLVLSGFPLGVTDPDAVDTVDPIRVTFSVTFGTLTVDTTDHPGVTVISGNNTGTVVIQGTESALNPFLQDAGSTPGLKYTTDAVNSGNIVLTMTSDDMGANPPSSGAQTDTDSATIIVNAINDPPVNRLNGGSIGNGNNSIGGFLEDSGFTLLTSQGGTLSISDDASASAILQTTLHVNNGTLNVHNTSTSDPDTSHNGTAISGDLTSTITLTGTLAQINATLATLRYRPNPNFDGNETLSMTTNDNGNTGTGGAMSDSDNVTLVVGGDNDAPINLWNGTSFNDLGGDNEPDITVNEDTDFFFTSASNARITISDVDASTNSGDDPITVTLSVGQGSLKWGSTSGLSNVTDEAGTISARGTVSEINNALNNLRFRPGQNNLIPTQLTITTNDGTSADVDRVDISINAVNDAPVITVQNLFPNSQSLNEDSTLIFNPINGNQISISDVDGNSVSVSLQILGGVGKLNTAPSSAAVSGNDTSTVTISGTIPQVNQALNGMGFTPNQDFYGNATLRITANDLGNTPPPAAQSTRDVQLAVNPVNDAPVNRFNNVSFNDLPTSGSNGFDNVVSTPQDQAFIFNSGNAALITVTDVDANAPEATGDNANLLTVRLTVTNGFLTLGSTSGVSDPDDKDGIAFNNASQIEFRGTLANINNALNGLRYTPNANFAGTATLTILSNDLGNFGNNGNQTDQDNVLIQVANVNDPPSFNVAGTIVLAEPDVDTIFTGQTNPPSNHPATGSAQQHLPVLQDFITAISAGALVGTELNENVTFNFTVNDPAGLFKTGDGADPGTPEIIPGSFNITTGNAGTNDTTADIRFEIGADKFGTAVITVTASDQNLSDPDHVSLTSQPRTFLVIVTPENDVPEIELPPTQSVMEDGMLTLSADAGTTNNPRTPNQIIINDDSGLAADPQNIDVRLGVLNGTLQLQSIVGLSVTGQNTNSILINGTQPAIQAALNQGLKYTPNANYNSTRGSERLRVEVDDFGHEGGPDINPFDDPNQSGVQDRWDARADLTINVSPKNDPVVLINSFPDLSRPEDAPAEQIPLGINLILGSNFFDDADKNDTPPETITVMASSSIGDGSDNNVVTAQVVGANLILTYAPDQSGSETITVTASDGETSASDTFIVTIGGVNDPPTITHLDRIPDDGDKDTTVDLGNDEITNEDVPLVFTGVSKITVGDPEDASLFVTLHVQSGRLKLDNPAATLSVSGDNTNSVQVSGPITDINNALDGMVYTPNLDFSGVDPLLITATDSFPVTSQLTIEINVNSINDPPVANPDSFVVTEGSSNNLLAVGANDTPGPPNEAGQTIVIAGLSDAAPNTPGFQSASFGTISIDPSGQSVTYTPARTDARGRIIGLNNLDQPPVGSFVPGDFYGMDSFQYIIRDNGPNNPTSVLTTVSINVTPINDAPFVDVQPASQPPGPDNNPNNIQTSRTITMAEDSMQLLSNLVYVNDDAAGQIEVRFTTLRPGSKVFVDGASEAVVNAGGLNISGNDSNAVTVVGTPAAIRAAIADADSKYTPELNFNENVGNGNEQLVIRAEDFGQEGGGTSLVSTGTINFDITAVADAPTINFDPNPIRRAQVSEATNVEIKGYAGDPNPGDEGSNPKRVPGGPDEIANQDVNITSVVELSDPSNVVSNVQIDNDDGDLRFTINPGVVGNAVVRVGLQEVGGALPLAGTVDFTISVGFNKEPVFDLVGNVSGNLVDGDPGNNGDIVVSEDTDVNFINGWLANLFAGPADDFPRPQSIQSISIDILSGANLFTVGGQPRLIDFTQPQPPGLVGGGGLAGGGDLTFTLADNQSGAAQMRITIVDNGGQIFAEDDNSATKTFSITVTSDNDPPSFTIPNAAHSSLEDAGLQIVNGFVTNINANDPNQNVTFNITSNSNAALFSSAPTINPAGTLTYQAAPNASGQAILTVVAMDDGGGNNTSAAQTFAISVTPINDAPTATFNPDPVTRDPNLGLQLLLDQMTVSPGPGEAGQAINSVVVTNVSNPGLFSVLPAFTQSNTDPANYHLTFQSAAGASGSSAVTVTIVDNGGTASGGTNTGTATFQIVIGTPSGQATVVGRQVFYKDSAYDASQGVTDILDDAAIDSSKVALLPGQTSTFANSTGYGQGLNGVMIDVQNLANPSVAAITNALSFRTGTASNTSTWTPLPAGSVENVAVRQLNANTHRITVAFANRAIVNRWLEVRLAANADTGLAATDVHYWGNAPGNTGSDLVAGVTDVGGGDLQAIAQNLNFLPTNLVTNRFDLNKDRATNAFDWQVVATNLNFNALPGITPTGAAGVAGGEAAFSLAVGADSGADETEEVISDGSMVDTGSGGTIDERVGSTADDDRDLAFATMDDSSDASTEDDLLDLLASDLLS